jgi:hypothetical protein
MPIGKPSARGKKLDKPGGLGPRFRSPPIYVVLGGARDDQREKSCDGSSPRTVRCHLPRKGPLPRRNERGGRQRRTLASPGELMSTLKIGREHKARKALFTKGIRRGFLTLQDIDEALPAGSLTDAERWLLFYSLHAARVEVRDSAGHCIGLDELRPARDQAEPAPDEGDSAFDQ